MNNKLINAVHQALQLTKYDDYKNGHEIPDKILINEMFNPKSDHHYPPYNEGQVKSIDFEKMAKKLVVLSEALSARAKEQL